MWIEVAGVVNKLNCIGDCDWQSVRKKWQDLTSSARKKYRGIIREQKKTGGAVFHQSSLSLYDCLAIESVSEVSVKGID